MSSRCEMTAVSCSLPASIRANSTTFRIGGVTRNPSDRASRSWSVRTPRRLESLAPLARNPVCPLKLTTLKTFSAKRATPVTKSISAKPAGRGSTGALRRDFGCRRPGRRSRSPLIKRKVLNIISINNICPINNICRINVCHGLDTTTYWGYYTNLGGFFRCEPQRSTLWGRRL